MSESAPKRLLKREKPQKPKGPVVAVVTLVAVMAPVSYTHLTLPTTLTV